MAEYLGRNEYMDLIQYVSKISVANLISAVCFSNFICNFHFHYYPILLSFKYSIYKLLSLEFVYVVCAFDFLNTIILGFQLKATLCATISYMTHARATLYQHSGGVNGAVLSFQGENYSRGRGGGGGES